MHAEPSEKMVEILLVDDDDQDVELTVEALKQSKVPIRIKTVADGVEAMAFLRRSGKYASSPRPDIILLDLNMPGKNGRETLAEIKRDPDLKTIPVVILTTSTDEDDVLGSYELHANCYVNKTLDMSQFMRMINTLEEFWFRTVRLPRAERYGTSDSRLDLSAHFTRPSPIRRPAS